jgi:hypothetical protein
MKVDVWCTVSARIVVLVFYNKTIKCKEYLCVERAIFSTPPVIHIYICSIVNNSILVQIKFTITFNNDSTIY